jgi:hypothetical protein
MKKLTHRTTIYSRKFGRHPDNPVAAQLKVIRRYARKHGLKIMKVATDGES